MIVNDIKLYDGDIIHHRFAYTYFRNRTLPIGNILAFRAPMKVEADGMIDLEVTFTVKMLLIFAGRFQVLMRSVL